ncbi:MAG TPA: DNA-processing protein DprA [Phycisphaerae bacterium]|nr:DNA-processing protein DprA [Phycisphaerae bacterium]
MVVAELRTVELLGGLNETERKHAPRVLFTAGDLRLLRRGPRISVIGSSKASPDGLTKARLIANLIVTRGGVVISGLAEGIDTAAHVAALEAKGSTVAVIGTSLCRGRCSPDRPTGGRRNISPILGPPNRIRHTKSSVAAEFPS